MRKAINDLYVGISDNRAAALFFTAQGWRQQDITRIYKALSC